MKNDLKNEENFFYPYKREEQIQFDSFILDQRTKEGRIVNKWLQYIKKKEKQVSIQDIADFEKKLSHTFLHTYDLTFNKYFECVRIFVYRCVLRRKMVRKIVENVLENNSSEMQTRDQMFQKKTFWMRSLKYDKLGINQAYWCDPTQYNANALNLIMDAGANNNNSSGNNNDPKSQRQHRRMATNESDLLDLGAQKSVSDIGTGIYESGDDDDDDELDGNQQQPITRKRTSLIGYVAGSGVPYADAINLIGQLEPSNSPAALRAAMEKARQKEMESAKGTNHATNDLLKDEDVLIDSDDISKVFAMPDEGLQILLNAVKCIHETAMKYFRLNKQMSDLTNERGNSDSVSLSVSKSKSKNRKSSGDKTVNLMDSMDALIDNIGNKDKDHSKSKSRSKSKSHNESKHDGNEKEDSMKDQPLISRVKTEKQYIGSDDLFPIVVYCVIQSKLETPHKFIEFVEAILPSEKTKMGQAAFSLSVLKGLLRKYKHIHYFLAFYSFVLFVLFVCFLLLNTAAVEYIIQRKPTDFGLDAEIEF